MATTPSEIAQLWRRVNRQMHGLIRSVVEQYDLPPLAFPVLDRIGRDPGITISALARKLGTAKSHISTLTDQLARDGYVEKGSDPNDQRVIRLYITDTARELLRHHHERAEAMWATVFQELPERDLEDLGRFLRTLSEAFARAIDTLEPQAQDALTDTEVTHK